MVTIFCRVVAEISPDFVVNFPRQFDFTGMLTNFCKDVGVGISFQNDTFVLHGDWISIGRTHSMLVSSLAAYGNASSVYEERANAVKHVSRPFSALVEAAEAISRGVVLQEQVQNETTEINQLCDTIHSGDSTLDLKEDDENNRSNSIVNSSDSQEYISEIECSTQDQHGYVKYQNSSTENDSDISHQQQPGLVVPLRSPEPESNISHSSLPKRFKHNIEEHKGNLFIKDKNKTNDESIECSSGDRTDDVSASLGCNSCDFTTKNKTDLLNHKCHGHMKQVVKCDICDKIFSSITYLRRHLNRHKDVTYNCKECGNKYKDFKTLKEHAKTHEKDYVKPEFKCDSCTKSFCSVYQRECHYKSEHLGIKKIFLCQTCGKSFTTNKTLQQHVNGHKGIKPYKCSHCEKCFTYESALNDHLFLHVDMKTFICEFSDCKKAFRQRSALKMHEQIHKNPNQFECSECGRGFTQKQALQRHIRSHKGLKPFKCKYCKRSFGDLSIIRRHMKLVHKINKDIDKWREDIIEETMEEMENYKEKAGDGIENNSLEVTVDQVTETTKEETFKQTIENITPDLKENSVQIENTDTDVNSSNIQNVFVTFNLPGQNLVLANPASSELNRNPSQLIQYQFKAAEVADSMSDNTVKSETESLNSKPDTEGSDFLQESDDTYIEREQIQFLTENLDGTFNTSVDFSKLKRNLELLTKSSSSIDVNLSNDQPTDILKPDGTEAELPLSSSPDNTTRLGELETLSDSLGLSVSQFQSCYYNLGNQ